MKAPIFVTEKLTKKFGGLTAVNEVDLQVNDNEILGLIGPNGAGKSTLLKLVMSILKQDYGKVYFKGKDITNCKTWKVVENGIACTFQNTRPFKRLPIIANVIVSCLGPRAAKRGEWVKKSESRAMDALEFAGISDMAFEPASRLSQGDLKRLEVARAIATEPEMMLIDEPFGGLNPSETELLAKSIRRLHHGGRFGKLHSEGMSMIIVEHKLSELMKIVDRVAVMHFGQIIAVGTPEDIIKDERVVEAYIGKEVV